MNTLVTLILVLCSFAGYSQTAKELIGKWKLVKQTNNGVVSIPKDTYQVFMPKGKFQVYITANPATESGNCPMITKQ